MNYRCGEIDDLLAPFALDALEPSDRTNVLEHLADCRRHDEELAAYRRVSANLALVLDEVETPAGLGQRLLSSFDSAVAANAAPEALPSTPRPPLLRRLGFAYGLAAALLAIAIGLGIWGLTSSNEKTTPPAQAVIVRQIDQDGMHLRVTYLQDQQVALLNIQMPPLATGRVYQGWQITAAGPVSLGLLQNNGLTAVSADLSGASAIAVSVEPVGGSPQPTTTPVIVSEF